MNQSLVPSRLHRHLSGTGPKRILALDGGGVRGMLTLGILERIESILNSRWEGQEEFRLCHYVDLICGTSAGAIIAAPLALGFSVREVQNLYKDLAPKVFKKKRFHLVRKHIEPKFARRPLLTALEESFQAQVECNPTLGSEKIQTGLAILVKRLKPSGHVWAIHNNPKGNFYDSDPATDRFPNKDYSLAQLVRASTAAPYYFRPERLPLTMAGVGEKENTGTFVDGGISPFNNPALAALMLASLKGCGFNWEVREDKLLLVSLGTGWWKDQSEESEGIFWKILEDVGLSFHFRFYKPAAQSVILDCDWLTQAMLQWLSASPTARNVHGEIKDLKNDLLGNTRWISYLRYNTELGEGAAGRLRRMDAPENCDELLQLGRSEAREHVREEHFPQTFNVLQ